MAVSKLFFFWLSHLAQATCLAEFLARPEGPSIRVPKFLARSTITYSRPINTRYACRYTAKIKTAIKIDAQLHLLIGDLCIFPSHKSEWEAHTCDAWSRSTFRLLYCSHHLKQIHTGTSQKKKNARLIRRHLLLIQQNSNLDQILNHSPAFTGTPSNIIWAKLRPGVKRGEIETDFKK